MILGVGTDMIEIERIKKACAKEAFLMRVFTEEERRQADGNTIKLAGSFAVKEAAAKALGTGFRAFMPKDIEVLRDSLGKPYVCFHGGARARYEEMGMRRMEVSISDTKEFAFGFAVGEGEG